MENKKKKKGFTLIEMVVVIAIIAIIAGIAIPQAFKSLNKSKATADIANAKTIANAITQGLSEEEPLTITHKPKEADVWKKVDDITFINTYLSNVPVVKKTTGQVFLYSYDGDNLKIGVGAAPATTGGTTSDAITLFPTSDGY